MLLALGYCHVLRNEKGKGFWACAMAQSSWKGAFFLFLYMIFFSLGYVDMPSGTGTLIQNSAVQASMIGWGVYCGLRPGKSQIAGLLTAFIGLAILMFPSLASPPLWNGLLIGLAGASWGFYCMAERNVERPDVASAGNFIRASAFALPLLAMGLTLAEPPSSGALICALASGAGTSALGYTLWINVLPRLSVMSASISQLAVPPITGLLGFFLLGEQISARLVVCAAIILAGIWLALRPGSTAAYSRD